VPEITKRKTRRLHKLIGIALLLPVLAWAVTGVFFLVRPAYSEAYETLQPRTYAPASVVAIAAQPQWLEMRYLLTVLGPHLLVREASGWHHLHGQTGEVYIEPGLADLERLVSDALSQNPQRYGQLLPAGEGEFVTSTGVTISLNWQTLSFYQSGRDTRWIDRVYDIHYLRWTGLGALDEIIGILGLILLVFMSLTGMQLLLKKEM
jgi:hypothetical protein